MKKIRILILAFVLVIICFGAQKTYSYYVDEHDRVVSYDIASWIVKVNNTDITTDSTHEFTIDDLSVTNANVNRKFAPGTDGTFTILVDLTDVQTSADVQIFIGQDEMTENNWVISRATVDHGSLAMIDDPAPGYWSALTYNVINTYKRFLYTFKISWPDVAENNQKDTELGSIKDNVVSIPVNVKVTQRS